MTLEGHKGYEHQLYVDDAFSPAQKAFLHDQWKLFRNWWPQWPGAKSA